MSLPIIRSTKLMDHDCAPHGLESELVGVKEETVLGGVVSLMHATAMTREAPQDHDADGGENDSIADAFPALASTKVRYWLHITKCGTSFANAFLHTPSLCPDLTMDFEWKMMGDNPFTVDVLSDCCPELILSSSGHFGPHDALGSVSEKASGSVVTMLRNPEQRILSSYQDNFHDWPGMSPPSNELEFALVNAGCQVRMVVRNETADGDMTTACMHDVPTEEEVALARTTLRRNFSFVGILEQYDLSVCLFRVMFGGPCSQIMFSNVHKGGTISSTSDNTSATLYDTEVLQGFVDQADTALYEEGLQMFHEMLLLYNVSNATCQSCYASP